MNRSQWLRLWRNTRLFGNDFIPHAGTVALYGQANVLKAVNLYRLRQRGTDLLKVSRFRIAALRKGNSPTASFIRWMRLAFPKGC